MGRQLCHRSAQPAISWVDVSRAPSCTQRAVPTVSSARSATYANRVKRNGGARKISPCNVRRGARFSHRRWKPGDCHTRSVTWPRKHVGRDARVVAKSCTAQARSCSRTLNLHALCGNLLFASHVLPADLLFARPVRDISARLGRCPRPLTVFSFVESRLLG